jgi:hypothetical protein
MQVAPGLIEPGQRYSNLMHVTDWLPTLTQAVGIDISSLGSGFAGIDGVSHWAAMTHQGGARTAAASSPAHPVMSAAAVPPRTEILFNIDGVNGTGAAALRVGNYKLLRSQCSGKDGCGGHAPGDGFAPSSVASAGKPAAIPSLGMDRWCDVCTVSDSPTTNHTNTRQ